MRSCSVVHDLLNDYMREREVQLENDIDQGPLESFVDQQTQESSSHAMLRHQLLSILAGRDTTACSLSWTLSVPPSSTRYS